jgi:hypothetical protein
MRLAVFFRLSSGGCICVFRGENSVTLKIIAAECAGEVITIQFVDPSYSSVGLR